MRIIKSYGLIAAHGAKSLKLETIQISKDTGQTLALVSYKDGMIIKYYEYTKEEAKEISNLLCDYLDYRPIKAEPKVEEVETETEETEETEEVEENTSTFTRDIIKTLTTLPSGDVNYQTAIREATKEEIASAITIMKESGGRHATRIKFCEDALKRLEKKGTATVKKIEPTSVEANVKAVEEVEPPKPEPKVYKFPTDEQKPQIIPLHTEGNRTYGECVVKIQKESETFIDGNSQYVLNGIRELCKADQDFRNNFMREDKTFGGFLEYMFNAGMNGYYIQYGNQTWLDTDLSLALAIDYYNNDSDKQKEIEEEERKKREAERKALIEANKKETKKRKTTTKGGKKNGNNVSKKKGRTTA